jgi:hypothetical protein
VAWALLVIAGCSSGSKANNDGGGGGDASAAGGAGGAAGQGGGLGAGGAAGQDAGLGAGGSSTPDAGDAGSPPDGGASVDSPAPDGGGDASADAAASGPVVLATFDVDTQGFVLSTDDPFFGNANLVLADGGVPPSLVFDGTQGQPAPGALKVTAPYTDYNQYVDVQKSYGTASPQDWTGKVRLSVRLKVAAPFTPDPMFPPAASIYAASYMPDPGGGAGTFLTKRLYQNLAAGTDWHEIAINLPAVMLQDWDQSKIVKFGVQLFSGDASGAGDGGVPGPSGKPTQGVFYVDTFTVE